MPTASKPTPTPAPQAQPELESHEQWLAKHSARVAVLNRDHAVEIQRLEAATRKATAAHTKATADAATEHAAERLRRHAAAVEGVTKAFAAFLAAGGIPRTHERVAALGQLFREQDAVKFRITGHRITNELGVMMAESFAATHPGALARFAYRDNWTPLLGFGIQIHTNAVSVAFRDFEFDLIQQLDAVLRLESCLARLGTAAGYQSASADEVEARWAIIRSCWPGDIDEAKRLAHDAEVKRRAIAKHTAETVLKVNALTGDETARATLRARGAEVLEDVIRSGKAILAFAGWDSSRAEETTQAAARSLRQEG